MKDLVSLRRDGVILVTDPESLDVPTVHEIVRLIQGHAQQLRRNQKPVLVLVDSSQLKEVNTTAKKLVVEQVTALNFDLLVVFGNTAVVAHTMNFMLIALRLVNKKRPDGIKFFAKKRPAEQWLKAYQQ